MTFPGKHRLIIVYLLACLMIYSGLFILLINTGVYNIDETTNNDRFFSMDDVYYVTKIYSKDMDSSLRIVKHPLFMVFGNVFSRLATLVFGNLSYESCYILIVSLQIMVQILSLLFLYKILSECYQLPNKIVLVLLSIYALSVSALIFTFFSESYIFSGAALIVSYYYFLKRNTLAAIISGIITIGITITNLAIWAIMALLLVNGIRRKILTICFTATAFILVMSLMPIGMLFFNNFTYVMNNSPKNYSDSYDLPSLALRSFYSFFGTKVFYVDTVKQSPFGQYQGRAISFLPSSSILILLFMLLWIGLLGYSIIKCHRNRLLYAPLAVLAFNLLLHGVKQYGLKEAFLYSLHHFFAQIMIVAAVFIPAKENNPVITEKSQNALHAILAVFLSGELILNFKGYFDFYAYILTLTSV